MTEEQMRDLVKECGLDWHKGYMPLFDGDPTNRYAVLIGAAIAEDRRAQPAAEPVAWMTQESLHRLRQGGNDSRGSVPVHAAASNVAKIPLFMGAQPAAEPAELDRLRTVVANLANAPTLTSEQVCNIAFAVLRAHNDDRLWRALTYDSGPYDLTTPNLALQQLGAAFYAAGAAAKNEALDALADEPVYPLLHPGEMLVAATLDKFGVITSTRSVHLRAQPAAEPGAKP